MCRVPFSFITLRSEVCRASSFPVMTFWRGICQTPFESPNNLCHLVFLSLLLLTATKDSNRLERTPFFFFLSFFLLREGWVCLYHIPFIASTAIACTKVRLLALQALLGICVCMCRYIFAYMYLILLYSFFVSEDVLKSFGKKSHLVSVQPLNFPGVVYIL